ncbi:MAG TPA: type II secretion system F family protein [Mycobacteriales bacterium]|nr:type II secretion system F family protein [Mycobacteriales bacterium]
MGAFLGLVLGIGLLLIWRSGNRRPPRSARVSTWNRTRTEMLRQAGVDAVSSTQLLGMQIAVAVAAGLVVLVATHTVTIALCFAVIAFFGPVAIVRRLRSRRSVELREVWPEVVDNLASAVRAGLALPEALSALGLRGPEQLRPHFARFGADYRATGRFMECLDRLKESLADPVGDRVCETLRVAREVGGTDLGQVLRTLSAFLREDARTRGELETRQGWTVNAARLAVAAPWLVLLLLGTQSNSLNAYDSPTGTFILVLGGVICVVAYRVMMRIGKLPQERRVLR